jgi:nucleoid-associated protein YgaU
MTRPTQGQNYTAKEGDTLRTIATRAYGLGDKYTLIRNGNQFEFPADTDEDVQPGEQLFIPFDPELINLQNNRA